MSHRRRPAARPHACCRAPRSLPRPAPPGGLRGSTAPGPTPTPRDRPARRRRASTPVMSITELPRSRVTLNVEGWPVPAVRSLRIQVQSVRDRRCRHGEWRALTGARSDAEAHDVLVEDQSRVGSRVARWQVVPAPRVAEPLLTEARRDRRRGRRPRGAAPALAAVAPIRGTSPTDPHRVRWSGPRRRPPRGRRAARADRATPAPYTSVRNR